MAISPGSVARALMDFVATRRPWKKPRRHMTQAEFRRWLEEHPEVSEGARRGFEDIRAGRYRVVSRSKSEK